MSRKNQTEKLMPIPRIGLPDTQGWLLYILITIAAAIPSLALASAMGTTPLSAKTVEGTAVSALLVLGYVLIKNARNARGMIPVLLVSSFFLTMSFGTVLPAAIILSWLFIAGEGALLMATADQKGLMLFPLVPIGAFFIAYALGGSWDGAVLSLLPFPAAVALGLGTRSSAAKSNGLTRVGVICLTTFVSAIAIVGLAAYALYAKYGTLSFGLLGDELEAVRLAIIQVLEERFASAGAEIASPETITNIVNELFNLLPGYSVVFLNVFAAVAQMFLLSGLRTFGFGESVSDRVRAFRVSTVSGAVFLVAYVTMLVTSGETSTLPNTVAGNLVIILQIGLALSGLLRFTESTARRGKRGGCAPMLILILPCVLFLAPTVLALFESIAAVTAPLRARMKPHTNPWDSAGGMGSDNDSAFHPEGNPTETEEDNSTDDVPSPDDDDGTDEDAYDDRDPDPFAAYQDEDADAGDRDINDPNDTNDIDDTEDDGAPH